VTTAFGGPGQDDAKRRAEVDGGVRIEEMLRSSGLRRFGHQAMATVFEVHAVHPDSRYAAQAAQAAFDLTDRLERELSRFLTNSDVARVNSLGAGESTRVGPATLECLLIARHMYELTGGAFDISIGTGLPLLALDPEELSVRALEKGISVDLGGIGKGYAVDLMAELLEEWNLTAALVHGGFSSVLALDPPPGLDGWPLTLSDPKSPSRTFTRLTASQRALGASGLRKGDHIVDPRSAEPVRGRVAAWVSVPRPQQGPAGDDQRGTDGPRAAAAAVADALTTAFMLLPLEEIEGLCDRTPGLEAWVLPGPSGEAETEAQLLHFGAPSR
jgi:thiamine biosynthesis lipoprotein